MGVRIVVPKPVIWLKGFKIDYSLTPEQAEGLLPGSSIASWPADLMGLWNGGKTGVVERAALPIYWERRRFTIAQCRQKQEASGIGFGWPVELASLALPENKPERIARALNKLGMWILVVLRPRDKELLRRQGSSHPFCFNLEPDSFHYLKFFLITARGDLSGGALVGAPQVQDA